MGVSYFGPLSAAWQRTRRQLFPVRFQHWLVLGFSAWLAGLGESGGGGGGGSGTEIRGEPDAFGGFTDGIAAALSGLEIMVLLVVLSMIAVLALVVLWISSRGKFIFLDNLVHEKAEIVNPWKEYAGLGWSLFVWRLLFTLVFLGFLVAGVAVGVGASQAGIPPLLGLALITVGVATVLFFAYVVLFLENFVVPIMYAENISCMQAWVRFAEVALASPLAFFLYGIFQLGLGVALLVAVMIGGFLSCCLGFLLLIIPYVGTVLLLPALATLRLLGPEFLGQFNPSWRLDAASFSRGAPPEHGG